MDWFTILSTLWSGVFLMYSMYLNVEGRHQEAVWAVIVALYFTTFGRV